jgi:ComF family protein
VHLYKYEGVRPLTGRFGEWLALALPREKRFDLIVPLPLHWWKRWQRGFNQTDLLASEIARRWNVPVRRIVRRRKRTTPQAGLTNAQRRLNVRAAFAVSRTRLDGLRVLLVDDVLTTGATAGACARALKQAGAAHVTLLALARTDRRTAIEDRELSNAAAWSGAARAGSLTV